MPSTMQLRNLGHRARRVLSDMLDPVMRYPLTHEGLRSEQAVIKQRAGRAEVSRWEAAGRQVQLSYDGPYIDPQDGYMIHKCGESAMLQDGVALCRRHYPPEFIVSKVSNPSKKDTLLSIDLDLDDPKNSAVKKIALSPNALAPSAHYFGVLPILYGAYVWFSRNRQNFELTSSQLYHFDRLDAQQLKVFIPIDDITEESGPLTLVPAGNSRAFINARKKRAGDISLKQRFDDQEVTRLAGIGKGLPMVGKSGDMIFFDTTNCLHFGSRPSENHKYHMVLHYVTPFCKNFSSALDISASDDIIEDMVMKYVRSIADKKVLDLSAQNSC